MKKFVIADQSVVDAKGHYLSYDQSVLEAAKNAGYEAILLTNRSYASRDPLPFQTFPAFTYTYWESLSDVRKETGDRQGPNQVARRISAILSGRAGIKDTLSELFAWNMAVTCLLLPLLALAGAVLYVMRAYHRLSRPRAPVSDASHWEEALSEAGFSPEDRYKGDMFRKELREALASLSLKESDLVFIPTISEVELAGVLRYLNDGAPELPGKLHMLFRRNIFEGTVSEYDPNTPAVVKSRYLFRQLEPYCLSGKVKLYTDTEELNRQYGILSECGFTALPIPHTLSGGRGESALPLNIVYLGDARTEKGYQYIPALVDGLFRSCLEPGKCRFLLQSNFNIPGGEPAVRGPVEYLTEYDPRYVRTFNEPLPKEEYEALSRKADINLILYDARQYYARSSGVFAEAMALGTPVLIPANTWMSHQFSDYRGIMLRKLIGSGHARALEKAASSGEEGGVFRFRVPDAAGEAGCFIFRIRMDWSRDEDLLIAEPGLEGGIIPGGTAPRIPVERTPLLESVLTVAYRQRPDTVSLRLSRADGAPCHSRSNVGCYAMLDGGDSEAYLDPGVVCLREEDAEAGLKKLIDRHDAYRAAASRFSSAWSQFHSAENLLKMLEGAKDAVYAVRDVWGTTAKVTVIIPVYNTEPYLRECLDSVLSQTLREIEVICIDDGSTDHSAAIIEEYAERDSRVALLRQENAGAGAARNRGLERAGGEYVCFLDADDKYVSADILEYLYEAGRRNDAGAVRGNMKTDTGQIFNPEFHEEKLIRFSEFQFNFGFTLYLFRLRELRRANITFPDYCYHEDPVFCTRALVEAKEIWVTDRPFYWYRIAHKDHTFRPREVYDYLRALSFLLRFCREHTLDKLYRNEADYLLNVVFNILKYNEGCRTEENIRSLVETFREIDAGRLTLEQKISPKYLALRHVAAQPDPGEAMRRYWSGDSNEKTSEKKGGNYMKQWLKARIRRAVETDRLFEELFKVNKKNEELAQELNELRFSMGSVEQRAGEYVQNSAVSANAKWGQEMSAIRDQMAEWELHSFALKDSLEELGRSIPMAVADAEAHYDNVIAELKNSLEDSLKSIPVAVADAEAHYDSAIAALKNSLDEPIRSIFGTVADVEAHYDSAIAELKNSLDEPIRSISGTVANAEAHYDSAIAELKNSLDEPIRSISGTVADAEAHYDSAIAELKNSLGTVIDAQKQNAEEMHIHIDYFAQDILSYFAQRPEAENPLRTEPVHLVTDHPVAIYSNDHLHPWGTAHDNTRAPFFIRKCEELLGKNEGLAFMDIGCSGGGIVLDALLRGHFAVGLEGSDYSLKRQRAEWRALRNNLFTCDVVYPFEVRNAREELVQFDIISAWEVLEHIPESGVDQMVKNVLKHLKPGGFFIGTASQAEDAEPVSGAVLHITIRPQEWWEARFMRHGFRSRHELFDTGDLARAYGNPPQPWFTKWGQERSPYIVMQKQQTGEESV